MTYQVITGTLKARTAVHVGSGKGNNLTDALIRRDADGKPFVPGTAIAGALRTLATRLAPRLGSESCAALTGSAESCSCDVCHLFGDINPSDEEGAESVASRILVFNARVKGKAPRPLIRDGVGIDRVTRAAARAGRVKFDLEVLPAGTEFEVRFELRGTNDTDEQLLAAILAEWQAGRVWLGGRVARGLGAFTLENLEYKTLDLNSPDNLLKFLKEDEPWKIAALQSDWLQNKLGSVHIQSLNTDMPAVIARCWVTIEGTLQAEGPLLTNDATTSGLTGFDHAPLLAQLDGWQNPVLAGSGLRGVLRSHAERIARTLATLEAWKQISPDERRQYFLTKCPTCSPVESRPDEPLASCDALLKEAKVSSDAKESDTPLCLACQLFGSPRRGSRVIVEDAPYQETGMQSKPVLKILDFLAIDRFTGGGRDGAKFDALALWKPAFKLRLHLNNPQPWELGWLALVLRDLQEGWLRVGMGATKGFGQVTLRDWKATFGYLASKDLPAGLTALQLTIDKSGFFTTVEVQGGIDIWRTVAKQWVDSFNSQVKEFSRSEEIILHDDSYFGKVDTLYPVMKGDTR